MAVASTGTYAPEDEVMFVNSNKADLFLRLSPVADSKMYLNVHATSTDNGANIGIFNEPNHQSTKFYLQHTQDPEFFNFPNVGRAN